MAFVFMVVFMKKAYRKISEIYAKAQDKYEVGGVLLGYRVGKMFFVMEVTACEEKQDNNLTTFYLDGEKHTAMAKSIAKRYWISPRLLGVWHSHIINDQTFSVQDSESNKKLAVLMNGILSVLVIKNACEHKMISYFISATGEEMHHKTVIKGENNER